MMTTNSPEFAATYPATAAKLHRAKLDAVLPNFRHWERTDSGGATLNGYCVTKISNRAFVAYAPNGDSIRNSGDWTSADRPFANLLMAVAACRSHALDNSGPTWGRYSTYES